MNSAQNTYSAPASLSPLSTPSYGSTSTYGTTGTTFLGMSLTTWIIIILVLAILGFNIFSYLAKGTMVFETTFGPYIRYFTGLFGNTAANITKQVTNTAATGTKAGVDVIAGTVTSGVDVVQQTAGSITGASATSSLIGGQKTSASVPQEDAAQNSQLNAALNSATPDYKPTMQHDSTSFRADDSSSSIQASKSASKSGWCYIGEDRGFRSCIQVGENDTCMSGDIFPSQDICVNPSLRA
jgi:hypothetical protein